MGTIANVGYRQGSIYPASWKDNNIMYHKASFDAGKITRSIVISLCQAAVALGVAYVMYVGLWILHYGK